MEGLAKAPFRGLRCSMCNVPLGTLRSCLFPTHGHLLCAGCFHAGPLAQARRVLRWRRAALVVALTLAVAILALLLAQGTFAGHS